VFESSLAGHALPNSASIVFYGISIINVLQGCSSGACVSRASISSSLINVTVSVDVNDGALNEVTIGQFAISASTFRVLLVMLTCVD
jgi:hypothetical protein